MNESIKTGKQDVKNKQSIRKQTSIFFCLNVCYSVYVNGCNSLTSFTARSNDYKGNKAIINNNSLKLRI